MLRREQAYRTALFGGVFLATCPIVALAQSAPPPTGATASDGGAIEEVVVTAQKRTENVMSVPVTISVLSEKLLEEKDVQSLSDLTAMTPALQSSSADGENNPTFALRGVSMRDYNVNQGSPVALYTDDVYRSSSAFFSDQTYDLARVEVLAGPQGTLYGKDATGGLVNFISVAPGFDQEGYLTVHAGNYSRIETEGAFQTAISDQIAVRIAGTWTHADGYLKDIIPGPYDHDLGGTNEYGVRGSILWQPNSDFKAVLRIAQSETGPDPYAVKATPVPGSPGLGGGFYAFLHSLEPAVNPAPYTTPLGKYQTAATNQTKAVSRSQDASLTINWNISSNLDLTSVTNANKGEYFALEDGDGSPLQAFNFGNGARGYQYAEDARLHYHGDSLDLLGGFFYSQDFLKNQNLSEFATDIDYNGDGTLDTGDCLAGLFTYGYGCKQVNQFDQKRQSEAVYADGTYSITDALKLIVGARYSGDRLEVNNYTSNSYGITSVVNGVPILDTPVLNTIPGTCLFCTLPEESRNYTAVTGRAGLDYTLDDGILLYGMYSRGYRPGAVNAEAYESPTEVTFAKPETLESFEVGAKGEFLDDHLQVTAAAYHYNYNDQQAITLNPVTFLFTLVSLPRTTIDGLDLSVTGKPTDTLELQGAVTWLYTRIDSGFVNGVSVAGNQTPMSPRLALSTSADWKVFQTGGYVGTLYVAPRYIGKEFDDPGNNPETEQNGYWLVDARFDVQVADTGLSFGLWGKNITGTYYREFESELASFGQNYVHIGPPAEYGAEISYRF